jgi:hypothetical protein
VDERNCSVTLYGQKELPFFFWWGEEVEAGVGFIEGLGEIWRS